MFTDYRLVRLVVPFCAILALSACAPQAVETPALMSTPEPLTLRLAVSDKQGNASEPPVREFINQVETLSNGEITIELIWDAADESQAGFEGRVIQLVKGGQADLGLAASRAWTSEGINSFEALQAPFLINNDTLAQAVAKSDIATRMLDDLSESGLVGLTVWLEDLRHPFSLLPEDPILSPADIAGRNMRVTDTGISQKLIETLGGIPTTGEDGYDGAESGLRQTRTLSGTPTATGNVTFFPKYQVLFADGAAFDKLSESQQAILREAAAAAQERAIAEHPSEVEAAKTWCSDAGAVALASDEQIAAFEEAAQPVFAAIEQDPQNAELIAAIRELKTKTPPSPGVQACDYELAQQIRTPDAIAQTWSTGLPPNGTWQVTLTNDEVINMGVSKAKAPDWSGVYSFTFQDGVFHWTWEGTEGYAKGQTASLDGSYEVVEDFVRMTSGDVVDDVQWRLDEEGLHFHLLATQNDPFVEIRAMLEARPYQKVADT
jgi:TRAP-type C4-dicarboxylate transport system substrate-binding protein